MTFIVNLICPIRGELNSTYFAKDGITVSEEARRIDCIKFLLEKNYPAENFKCETVIIKKIGNEGTHLERILSSMTVRLLK